MENYLPENETEKTKNRITKKLIHSNETGNQNEIAMRKIFILTIT